MPRRIVNMEAIQTHKERVFSLVISRGPAASCRAPYREVQLALPPVHWSVLPAAPRLVPHIDVSSERGRAGGGGGGEVDSRRRCPGISLGSRFHLEAVPFVINHNPERERLLLFDMSPRPIFYGAFERESRLVQRYVHHTPTFKMGNRFLFPALRVGAGGRSL